ncbi:MAG: hypothetical protein ACPGWR_24380 [Ardenticatenaceae bacterium]
MNRSQRVMLIALVCVLLAAFALRLPFLGTESLWYDETVSAYLATNSLGELIAHTARDIHPPLYYILLHFWQVLAGYSEFGLAFFSLCWGILLVASSATFARWLGGNPVALLTAAFVTLSPFNVWYSQEVRMYTLGATFGVWTLMALWQLTRGERMKKRWMGLWLLSAVAGLYTLYYFAFLLLWEACFVLWWLWDNKLLPSFTQNWRTEGTQAGYRRRWVTLAIMVVVLWAPWIPIAWQQATNPPVPPWREGTPLSMVLLESLSALLLGQSAEYGAIWYIIVLLIVVVLFGLGLWWRQEQTRPVIPRAKSASLSPLTELFLLGGALCLPIAILIISSYTPSPLYHVRYVFTYSPVFYILLAMGFIGWTREANRLAKWPGALLMIWLLITPLLVLSGESLQRFWNDTTYAPDDLRGGVKQIEAAWRDEDVLLLNAGYTYTALNYYFEDPIAWQGRLPAWQPPESEVDEPEIEADEGLIVLQSGSIGGDASLGWGLEESDFYGTTPEETFQALNQLTTRQRGQRLWHFRLYDTVTDPKGFIRTWLDQNALLFYDQVMSGESNARVQGWLFPPAVGSTPERPIGTRFLAPDGSGIPWVILLGADEPTGPRTGGAWVDINLWLQAHLASDPEVRLSLGLFDTTSSRRQWAVIDEKPMGELLSLASLTGVQRWPVRLRLPQGIPPGKYDALLTLYSPSNNNAVLLPEGDKIESNGQQVQVGVVELATTALSDKAPEVGTPLEARFGPLQLLGHAYSPGPWEPGAAIGVELVWEMLGPAENVRAFVTSDVLLSDEGGVANSYPPEEWRPGEVVRDVHYVTVAPNPTPGEYPIYLRVSQGTNTIPWTHGLFSSGDVLQLGTLIIKDRPRTFEPPVPDMPLDIAFGESIQLIGITIPAINYQPSGEMRLSLNWQAIAPPPRRYKIFTHLIGPDGNLYAQRDLEPGDGLLPTNGWARGEYVTTNYAIPLPPEMPPGSYQLRVGLYDPVTNERVLPIGANADGLERYVRITNVEIGN